MKQSFGLAAVAVGTALAVPAVAAAHPSVYTAPSNGVQNGNQLAPQTRYVVSNHGFTYVLRETNDPDKLVPALQTQGVVGYNLIPGGWRAGKDFATVMATGGSAAQAHATCLTPALQAEAAIKQWQDADAFYNYVPFQSTSAGLEDDPAKWLPILAGLNVDTSRLADATTAAAECTKLGGTYYAADTVQTTFAALADGTVKEATAPLQSQITTLQTGIGSLQAQLAAATAPKPARALTLKLSAKRFDQGVAMVTGEPNTAVTVRARLSSAKAKKLKLGRTIASKTVTIDAQGAALVNLALTKKAAKAIDKHRPALKVTVEATAGAVKQTAAGTLTR